jgi:hypothetical protein
MPSIISTCSSDAEGHYSPLHASTTGDECDTPVKPVRHRQNDHEPMRSRISRRSAANAAGTTCIVVSPSANRRHVIIESRSIRASQSHQDLATGTVGTHRAPTRVDTLTRDNDGDGEVTIERNVGRINCIYMNNCSRLDKCCSTRTSFGGGRVVRIGAVAADSRWYRNPLSPCPRRNKGRPPTSS